MNSRSPLPRQFAVYGICVVAVVWLALAVYMETHFGIPGTTGQWMKRSLGWMLEFWLIQSFYVGIRRLRTAKAS